MKLTLIFFIVFCIALVVHADEEKITDEEIQELINGYKDFNTNNGMSAPVSWELCNFSQ